MDYFAKKDLLNSFRVIVDTREQATASAVRRYESFGCPYSRATLRYGDYTYNATLPSGSPLYDEGKTVLPRCVVERKMSLDELAGCFGRNRERFEREFDRAAEQGCRIYLLCENASWEGLINGRYRSKLHPSAFFSSIIAWSVRYGMIPILCRADTSGKLIREILYRDFKERVEHGEFE